MLPAAKQANQTDTWLRVLSHADYAKNGRVLFTALKGKSAIKKPAAACATWDFEISGGLHSLVPDLITWGSANVERRRQDALKRFGFVSDDVRFAGTAHASVAALRSIGFGVDRPQMRADVAQTPKTHDPAHADVVVFSASGDDLLAIIGKTIIEAVKYAPPDRPAINIPSMSASSSAVSFSGSARLTTR